jgi:hypothetical protein
MSILFAKSKIARIFASHLVKQLIASGSLAERFNALVLKTSVGE